MCSNLLEDDMFVLRTVLLIYLNKIKNHNTLNEISKTLLNFLLIPNCMNNFARIFWITYKFGRNEKLRVIDSNKISNFSWLAFLHFQVFWHMEYIVLGLISTFCKQKPRTTIQHYAFFLNVCVFSIKFSPCWFST